MPTVVSMPRAVCHYSGTSLLAPISCQESNDQEMLIVLEIGIHLDGLGGGLDGKGGGGGGLEMFAVIGFNDLGGYHS